MSHLIFTIITRAAPNAGEFLPEINAPANYKDEAKIAAYREEKRESLQRDAALDPDTGMVTAFAYATPESPVRTAYISSFDDEASLLRHFWNTIEPHKDRLCGWGILSFHLPFVLRRSMALGVRPSFLPDLRRYQTAPVLDLQAVLYNWSSDAKPLAYLGRRYGIQGLARPEMTDTDAETVWQAENQITILRELYRKMAGVYFPYERMPLEAAIEIARRIAADFRNNWPQDEWIAVSSDWSLNLFAEHDGETNALCLGAVLYPASGGTIDTQKPFPIPASYYPTKSE